MSGISFFMPAYNCEATVEESIHSIFGTNFDFAIDELIVVNDCSTDGTLPLLNKIKEKFPQLVILNNPRNKGGASTRNIAIENTKNELLFCLDSDNVLAENSINKLKQTLLDKRADIAAFEEIRFFQTTTDKITHVWKFDNVEWNIGFMLSHSHNPPSSGNYLFTKTSWLKAGGYPEFAKALDTWGFGIRQLFSNAIMVICENSFYFHRYGHDSYWMRENNKGKTSLTALQVLIPYFDFIEDESINYMMSESNRYNWFENIDKIPIRITKGKKKASNQKPGKNNSLFHKLKRKMGAS